MIQAFWFDLNSINAGGSRPDGLREAAADQGGRARRRHDGRRHRLRQRPRRHRGRAQGRLDRGGRAGQGLLAEAARQGRRPRQADAGQGRRGAGPHHADRRLRRPRRLRPRRRGRLREGLAQARGVRRDSSRSSPPTRCSARTPRRCRSPAWPRACDRKADFIGLHFFSPVDKMPLLEIIRGEQTSDEALARALDYSRQIKKTPIVVNDSRGFFTSRVIGTFVNEALAMLGEGVAPSTDRAGDDAGRVPGRRAAAGRRAQPRAVPQDPQRDARRDGRRRYTRHPAEDVVEKMVELGRPGRLARHGLLRLRRVRQAHRACGRGSPSTSRCRATRPTSTCTSSRSGCSSSRPSSRRAASRRACCITTADANIGSIMGIGFPPWTGGVLQYINGYPGRRRGVRRPRRGVRRQVRRALRAEPAAAQEGRERRDLLTGCSHPSDRVPAAARHTA